MPRYFFHICNGIEDIDEQGHELPDVEAARLEAVRYGGGLLRDDPSLLLSDRNLRINVMGDNRQLCFAIVMVAVDANWQPDRRARDS